ncbi:MAG: hypothetical protein AAF549_05900 [Pseudomonadota bacterium]
MALDDLGAGTWEIESPVTTEGGLNELFSTTASVTGDSFDTTKGTYEIAATNLQLFKHAMRNEPQPSAPSPGSKRH